MPFCQLKYPCFIRVLYQNCKKCYNLPMSKLLRKILVVSCFLALTVFLVSGYLLTEGKKKEFKILGEKIENYKTTTLNRVSRSVISLPDDNNITIGMKDGRGNYKIPAIKREGVLVLEKSLLQTKLVEGIFQVKDPRLDAIIPMTVSSDSLDGSTYIILFYDRGDAAIEKSYARIGSLGVKVKNIEILPKDDSVGNQEYRVNIKYISDGKEKETTIPVADGHFDPNRTVSK